MELSLSHTLCLFNIFREFDGKENCAQVLEEEALQKKDTSMTFWAERKSFLSYL